MADLPVSRGGRRYGYKPNPVDHRDFGLIHPLSPVRPMMSRPPRSGNVIFMPPVKDQGDEGSCTAHAGSENFEYLARRWPVYMTTPIPAPVFSAQFLYYWERFLDGSLDQGDAGSTGRSSVSAMRKYGICLESSDPYIAGQFNAVPTPEQNAEAAKYISGAYHALGPQDVVACLASGYPVLMGFNVYNSFEQNIGNDGLMPTPDYSSEELLGGHEVLIYDYDDTLAMADATVGGVIVRNSWGTGFGRGGDFLMSYKQLADPQLGIDFTMQHLGKAW